MKTVYTDLVRSVERQCGSLFLESIFKFERKDAFTFILTGNSLSPAINHLRSEQREINALHWFDEFWIYCELKFIEAQPFAQTFITISIFQGSAGDNKKTQLFRAEWDNYENNTDHPQPHWHIYPFKYDSGVYEDFEAYNTILSEEELGFEDSLKERQSANTLVDIRNFHFAMNAEWIDKKTHVHRITNSEMVVTWFEYLLIHIKYQLQHLQ